MQRYNKYKTNLEGGTLSSINPRIKAGYQPSGGPRGPALRLIPSLILGLILDLVLPSQLVLYISYMYSFRIFAPF